jgi:ElaB/YqjD/DUF883 family membrane-anchored ribosome-binding protein
VSDQTQRSPEEIRSDIDQTRDELADTAAALAYKADVKARAKDRVDDIKTTVTGRASELKETAARNAPDSAGGAAQTVSTTVKQNPLPTAAIAAGALGFAFGYLLAHRGSK